MTKARQRVSKRLRSAKERKELIPKRAKAPEKPDRPKPIEISAAKGRPMLVWVGKRPLRQVTAFPAQHIESFYPVEADVRLSGVEARPPLHDKSVWPDWPKLYPPAGLLFHGDNKEVLAHLLANGFRGKVKLIYIDPPFDSGADYVRKVQLRGAKGTAKIDGEGYTLGEQIQYTDIWANDTYLQFMYERLLLMRELLSEDGSIFLHCDNRKNHHLRFLLDECFGPNAFVNEIIWRSTTFTGSSKAIAKRYPTNHNTIFWYKKGETYVFNKVREEYKEEYLARFTNPDNDPRGSWQSVSLKTYSKETFERLKAESRLIPPQRNGAGWRFKFYLDEVKGKVVETLWLNLESEPVAEERFRDMDNGILEGVPTVWLDINMANSMAEERTGYPTEKPDDLLVRLIEAHSNSGDLIADCFIGSGTTAAVAQKLGRRWIGCDINKGAIQTTSKRLQGIIREQIEEIRKRGSQVELGFETAAGSEHASQPKADAPLAQTSSRQKADGTSLSVTPPAQLSFEVYRVNDYDLQIQHNEAVNLACEHIGVTRTRGDAFFDGTLGKRLVKIIPFNHPLSPLDLEEVKKELSARPGEDRDIVVVCLGKELAADAWVEEWNRLRKKGDVPNKLEIIELRTDPKYGKFIKHEPARARVKISRKNDTIHVVIEDFISPTILERLSQQSGIVHPRIDDWRSMVDCVMIDTAYDGKVFNVALSDVPEKKSDLVSGSYELPAPKGKTKVAVKIVDMLGEEVVEVREG
jgi:DNA modification methylase